MSDQGTIIYESQLNEEITTIEAKTKEELSTIINTTKNTIQVDGCEGTIHIEIDSNGQTIENIDVDTNDNSVQIEKEAGGITVKEDSNGDGNYDNIIYDGSNEVALKDIALVNIEEISDQSYTGKTITPLITVKDGSTVLVQNTDYTLTYNDNINAGTATAIITGLGKYIGVVRKTFVIKKAENVIIASDISRNASTKVQSFNITAKVTGGTLSYKSSNSKISVSSTGKVKIAANYAGTATITLTAGDSNYKTVTKTIKIKINKISNTVTASNFTKSYSTKKQVFSIAAKRKGKGKITYSSNNKNVSVSSSGKITIKAKFIGTVRISIKVAANGIYKETTRKITVTVNPAKTSISKVTNTKGKKILIRWKKNLSVTGYQIMYSTSKTFSSGNKTVNIKRNSVTSKIITGLTKGKRYYIRIRTYKTVSGKKYYSGWSLTKNIKINK